MSAVGQGSLSISPKAPPAVPSGSPFTPGSANNGLSVDPASFKIVLGDNGNGDAALLDDRFIDLAGSDIRIQNGATQILETVAATNEVAVSIPNTADNIPLVLHNFGDNILKNTTQSFTFVQGFATTADATPTLIYQNTIGVGVLENHNFHLLIQAIQQGTNTSKSFIVQCSHNGTGATGTGITIIAAIGAAGLATATIQVTIAGDVMDIEVVGVAATGIEWSLFGFRATVATSAP